MNAKTPRSTPRKSGKTGLSFTWRFFPLTVAAHSVPTSSATPTLATLDCPRQVGQHRRFCASSEVELQRRDEVEARFVDAGAVDSVVFVGDVFDGQGEQGVLV